MVEIMRTTKQNFGFSQKVIVLALLAAIDSAYAADNAVAAPATPESPAVNVEAAKPAAAETPGANAEAAQPATSEPPAVKAEAAKESAGVASSGAQDEVSDEVRELVKPNSSLISVGLGGTVGDREDRAIFGQYNGWREESAGLLLDYELIRRDDASGLWTEVDARDLGVDNRELSVSQQHQGNWKYAAQYREMARHEPRSIIAGGGAKLHPELKRKSYTLSGEKWITKALSVEASFKSETKDGSRLFGVGNLCSDVIAAYRCNTTAGALLLVPEPIDSTIQQFEAKVNYAGDAYLISGGYYGSFYKNSNKTLTPTVPGSVNPELAVYLGQPVALPPDNEAHQLYLSGNYRLTSTTRANFNVSYTQAKQDDTFGSPATIGAPTNLGGELNKTFIQVGVTARPFPNLSLLGDWRKDDVDDETPMSYFGNTPSSLTKDNGKLEASYLLPDNYRVTAGIDYAFVKRARPIETTNIPATSLAALREKTEEVGVRFELKRSLSDSVNAAVSFVHSEREGHHWIGLTADATGRYPFVRYDSFATTGNTAGTFPFTMMDRTRNKLRAVADWAATERLSLQFIAEQGKDEYTAPTTSGMHDSGMRNIAIDATLNLSDQWKLTSYINHGEQSQHVDHSVGYIAELKNVTTSVGLGAIGKLSSKLEVGGDLSYLDDRNRFSLKSGNTLPAGVLPDVTYRVVALKLFGKYAIDKNTDIRADFIHQDLTFNEWTWAYAGNAFTYSDNSTVAMQSSQKVTYLGAKYVYKFN